MASPIIEVLNVLGTFKGAYLHYSAEQYWGTYTYTVAIKVAIMVIKMATVICCNTFLSHDHTDPT